MYKLSPGSRNHRSKGIKVKHVLQVCVLLAVCVWLIYQVKHSHDKKKEIVKNDSTKDESSSELAKLGRKDLQSRIEELATKNEKRAEKPEEETIEEEEEGNKPEEEDQERGNKTEDEKSDAEVDQEEDLVDEGKKRGEDDEGETEERDSVENDVQVEDENSLEVEDHDREEDSSTLHEAREENYKADDASSAVTHDTKVTTTENEHGDVKATTARTEANVLGSENSVVNITKGHNTTGLEVKNGGRGSFLNTTNSEQKGADTISSKSAETRDLSVVNRTQAISQDKNVTLKETSSGGFNLSTTSLKQGSSSGDMVENNQTDPNLTTTESEGANTTLVDSANVSANMDTSLPEKAVQGNASAGAGDDMGLALPLKDNNATEGEKSYNNDENGTNEGVEASNTDNLVEAQHDLIDTSVHLEEKNVRTDLETLPDIQTEGSNSEDVAAE